MLTPKQKALGLLLAPSLIGVSIFVILPSFDTLRRSFLNVSGTTFVGLDNFAEVLANEAFLLAARNTALFLVVGVPALLLISFAFALMMDKLTGPVGSMKAAFLLPYAVPAASVALVWTIVFDASGYANGLLRFFGMESIDWMGTGASFWVFVGAYIWRNLGYNIILWLAAFASIPEGLCEAARIDGASERQVLAHIVAPTLMPTALMIGAIAILGGFRVFRETYLVAGGYPNESLYMLQHLFNNWFVDMSTNKLAAATVLFVIFVIIVMIPFGKHRA